MFLRGHSLIERSRSFGQGWIIAPSVSLWFDGKYVSLGLWEILTYIPKCSVFLREPLSLDRVRDPLIRIDMDLM